MSEETKRNHIIKLVKKAVPFMNYLLIDTGTIIYIFNVKYPYKFNDELLTLLDKSDLIKWYFLNQPTKIKFSDWLYNQDIPESERQNFNLAFDKILKPAKDINVYPQNVKKRKRIINNYFEKLKINYDFSEREYVVFFVPV